MIIKRKYLSWYNGQFSPEDVDLDQNIAELLEKVDEKRNQHS